MDFIRPISEMILSAPEGSTARAILREARVLMEQASPVATQSYSEAVSKARDYVIDHIGTGPGKSRSHVVRDAEMYLTNLAEVVAYVVNSQG